MYFCPFTEAKLVGKIVFYDHDDNTEITTTPAEFFVRGNVVVSFLTETKTYFTVTELSRLDQ